MGNLEAAEQHTPEAGCFIEPNDGFLDRGREVVSVLPERRVYTTGGLIYNHDHYVVTKTATPEAGDYVWIPEWHTTGMVINRFPGGWWRVHSCNRTNTIPRASFTIITKARHIKQAMEGK